MFLNQLTEGSNQGFSEHFTEENSAIFCILIEPEIEISNTRIKFKFA